MVTEVELESPSTGQYRVRDFWNGRRDLWSGHRGFEIFRERFSEGMAEFNRQVVAELVEKREFLGTYYEAGGTGPGSA